LIIGVAAVIVILAAALVIWLVAANNSSKLAAEKSRAEDQKRQEDARRIEESKKAELEKKKVEEDTAKLEKSQQQQELWDAAAKSANQSLADKSNFETAIANLEKIKTSCKGTKFESMADTEIAKLAKAKNDFEELKRRKAEEDKRIADEAAKKTQAEKATAELEGKKSELIDSIASDIVKEDFKSASAKFAKEPSLVPELRNILEPLSKSDEIILASLQKEIGSTVSMGVENKTLKLKIKKVEGGGIYCEETVGKAMIVNKYAVKDLGCDEKIKRLSAANPIAGAVFKGISEIKAGKLDDAAKSCENCGMLSQPLKDKIDEMKAGGIETAAKRDFEKLLAKSESVSRMTEKDIGDFLKSIESFPEAHKTAKFAAGKADDLAKLSESANSALETLKEKAAPKEKPVAATGKGPKGVPGKIIVFDDFNYADANCNVLLSERTSVPTNLTGSKWQMVAGDGEYEIRIRGSALKPDSPNQASFHNVASSGLSIASKGSYVKPVKMLVRADLRFGDTSCEYVLLGFYSGLPGGRMMKPMTAFTGLKLTIDGSLVLVENGTEGKSIKWTGGAFDPVTFKTLSYTVSTANGSISDVSLSGSKGTYDFTSKSFTDTATAYLGIGGLGHSGHGEGYILIDNLVLSDLPVTANPSKNILKSEPETLKDKSGAMTDKQITVDLGGGAKIELVPVQPGKFTMGNSKERTEVRITRQFWMAKFEVTQEQYEKVVGANPSKFNGKDLPVEQLSWFDALEFCKKMNDKHGKVLPKGLVFRLPTEAEWEYAARGGNYAKGYDYSGSNVLEEAAWCKANCGGKTNPVGKKKPNELGIYDMSGNVWEWCNDWLGEYSKDSETDPEGAGSGANRVRRGGAWVLENWGCKPIDRSSLAPNARGNDMGFRLVIGYPLFNK